jgi:hypothetical protein
MVSTKSLGLLYVMLLAAVLLALPHSVAAHGVVDQGYTPPTSKAIMINAHMPIGQSLTPSRKQLLAVDVGIDNVLTMDQSYDPGFGAPGVGYNWIGYHTPIGQSFIPSTALLGAVDVGIFNEAILDQSFAPDFLAPGVGWVYVQEHQPIGQSFTPTYPQLWRVDLGLENPTSNSASLTLNVRKGSISGTIVGQQTFNVPPAGPSWVSVYFTPYPGVALTPGAQYVLDLAGTGAPTVRWYLQSPGGSYTGGSAVTGGKVDPNGDYLFKTYGFGDKITMNIRSDTIDGPVLATKTLAIPPMDSPMMVRFDLDSPVSVTPGSTYVIELLQSPRSVRWYLISPGGGYTRGSAITDGKTDSKGDYFFDTLGAGDSLTVLIRATTIAGAILESTTVTVPLTPKILFHVDLPAILPTTPGNQYVIELQQTVPSIRWYIVDPGGSYPGGSAIMSGTFDPSGDFLFNTYVPPGPIATSLSVLLQPATVNLDTSPGTGIITAAINPAVEGLPISIYYSTNATGPWTLINVGPTSAGGTYSVVWNPPDTGTYYFRADFTGTITYGASSTISAPNAMKVVPEFPLAATSIFSAFALAIFRLLRNRSKKTLKDP